MNLLAFFAPDAIPRDVIVAGAEHLPEPLQAAVRDEMQMDGAVGMARRYSLLQVSEGTFSMHRLVQTVARDRMSDNALKQWAEATATIVSNTFPSGDFTSDLALWDVCARLLPHALATADYAAALNVVPEASARLFNQAALYLRVRSQFAEGKQLFERALTIGEAAFGPDHPEVATAVNNLGGVLRELGDLAGAHTASNAHSRLTKPPSVPTIPKSQPMSTISAASCKTSATSRARANAANAHSRLAKPLSVPTIPKSPSASTISAASCKTSATSRARASATNARSRLTKPPSVPTIPTSHATSTILATSCVSSTALRARACTANAR